MKNKGWKIFSGVVVGALVVTIVVLWAGNDFQPLRSEKPPFQLRYDMQYQRKVSAQEPSLFFADRKAMRDYIPGTIPRDGDVYPYASYEEAEVELHNPYTDDISVIKRGKNRFDAFCATCHSENGQDTTEVVRKGMQKPPNLVAANAKGYSDARIFHIISKGQNVMPGYADKLTPDDRWKVVNYVRELQKQRLLYAEASSAVPTTGAAGTDSTAAPAASAQ